MGNNPDDFAVFLHLGKFTINFLFAIIIGPFFVALGEGLLLGFVPLEIKRKWVSSLMTSTHVPNSGEWHTSIYIEDSLVVITKRP